MQRSSNLSWSELKVGIFVMAAFLVVATAIVFLGETRKIFAPTTAVRTVMTEVKGLKKGAPVMLAGVEVGTVKEITLSQSSDSSGVDVVMEIEEGARGLLKKSSTASVRTQGLLGDRYIEISPGNPSDPPLSAGEPLKGTLPFDIQELVSKSPGGFETLNDLVDNMKKLVAKIGEGEGTAGRLVNDPALYNGLKGLSETATSLMKEIQRGKGTAGRLLKEEDLYQKLTSSATSLEAIGKKITEGEGTLGKLAADPSLYDNLNATVSRLDKLLIKVEKGEGAAGQLVNDPDLAREMKQLVVEARTLIEDIKKNPRKYFKFSMF